MEFDEPRLNYDWTNRVFDELLTNRNVYHGQMLVIPATEYLCTDELAGIAISLTFSIR